MRAVAAIAILSVLPLSAAGKLTPEERIELTRGLTAEYAKAKVLLPRSKPPSTSRSRPSIPLLYFSRLKSF